MQATVILNPNSGGVSQIDSDELIEAVASAGFQPVYQVTRSEEELDAVLKTVKGLVIAGGGDGTVRAVATRLVGKGVPIAILPVGTANNIWNTFSIQATPLEIIAGLRNPISRYFDIGYVEAPWGKDYFLEAFGYGLYADTLANYEPEKGKSLFRSINAISQTLSNQRNHPARVLLDGKDYSGDYLLFEVLNTKAMGPRLKLAPEADPSDGWFHVVRIQEDNRDSFLDYVTRLLSEDLDELPSVEVDRVRRIEIERPAQFPFHVDGEVRPIGYQRPQESGASPELAFPANARISVEILPQAIEFWLPQLAGEAVHLPQPADLFANLPTPPPFSSGPA